MANAFLTPQLIAKAALATLYETTVAAQLVHRDYSSEFAAAQGDTVTIRKPAVFVANEFDPVAGITIQDATEAGIPVVLNHLADVSFSVTAKEMALNIADFSTELLNPALEAISQKIDRDVLLFRNDITATVGTGTWAWSTPDTLIDAGVLLDIAKVPMEERRVIVGPTTRGQWLHNDIIKRAEQSGTTAGLRQGSIGQNVFGFDAYMSQNIGQPKAVGDQVAGDPTTEISVAFHRTAVALVTRQLELPKGAANAAILNYKGFGIRVVFGYDQSKKKDIISLDTLYGVKTLDANRAVLIKGANHA
jgi:hypothetical protein